MIKSWNQREIINDAREALKKQVTLASILVENAIKAKISVQGPEIPVRRASKGRKSGRPRKVPSRPGEPPHKDTGVLRSSIAHEVLDWGNTVFGFVGIKKGPAEKYGLRLEFGSSKIAQRPFLRNTFKEMEGQIRSIIK